ncbi:MAG: InlB B-repeat-containing protein, partial [Clostridia bacterium]
MTNIRNNAYKWLSYVIVICIMLQTAGVVRAEGDMQSDTYTLDFETTYSDASGNAYYSDNAENWSAANGSGSHAEMITENSNTAVRLTYDNERGNYNENAVMNIYNPETKNKFSGTAGVTYTITFDYKVEETDGKELQLFVAPSNREKGYPGQNAFTTTDMGPKAVILPAPAAGTPFIAASGTITQKTEGYVRASVQYTAQNAVSGHTVYPIIVLQTNNKTKDETHTGDRPYASVLIDNIEIKVPQSKSVICYNYDGGDKTLKVYDNTTFAELEVPSRAGYVFGGWYTNEALTNKAETDELVFDYDAIYARWVGGGEAKAPSQITDYFNTSWSRRFKDLSMDMSGLGEDV